MASKANIAKSRAEKGKATSATPAIAHEIIPGKYNDHEWNFMVDRDDADEYVLDIVEDVCSSALDIIYQNYIEKQLVPYTVSQAKDAILQIVEWQFLSRDEGEQEVETIPGWMQDEEPEPASTDCWAQGSVPKQKVTPRTPAIMEEDEEPAPLVDTAQIQVEDEKPAMPDTENQAEEEGGTSVAMEESHQLEEEYDKQESEEVQPENKQEQMKKEKRRQYKPHLGRLGSPGVAKMTQSLDETEMMMLRNDQPELPATTPDPSLMKMPASCHSMLKLQSGRPPGNRDIVFDEHGNVVSVTKLDPEKLPTYKVKTGFSVIDPAVEAAQARLEAMRTGRYVAGRLPKPPTSSRPGAIRRSTLSLRANTVGTTASKMIATSKESKPYDVVPLPAPMIEAMDVAPGVVVREGDRVKKGPRQHTKKMDAMFNALQQGLRPIQSRAGRPTLLVTELLEHQTPLVRPLIGNSPIPPISQYTPPIGS